MASNRAYVDFHYVRPEHADVHRELLNWAAWCFNRAGGAPHPMFRWAKPAQHWEQVQIADPVDSIAALRIERAVGKLPIKHQTAVRWSYVFQGPPRRVANELAVTMEGLSDLVHESRSMVRNVARLTISPSCAIESANR